MGGVGGGGYPPNVQKKSAYFLVCKYVNQKSVKNWSSKIFFLHNTKGMTSVPGFYHMKSWAALTNTVDEKITRGGVVTNCVGLSKPQLWTTHTLSKFGGLGWETELMEEKEEVEEKLVDPDYTQVTGCSICSWKKLEMRCEKWLVSNSEIYIWVECNLSLFEEVGGLSDKASAGSLFFPT